ncbi:MAG: putative porin [bacterium]|nr:MAG: putative porin [bacterium]
MKRLLCVTLIGLMILPVVSKAGEWHERIKLTGDFRHRHELIQVEDKDDRNRWRIRLRLSLEGEITDEWSAGVRLATGSNDPVSTNQTLDDGFTTKMFNLDRAYFDFHPTFLRGLHIRGGKMELPFDKVENTELIWDSDLSPEGAAVMYENTTHEKVAVFLSGAFFYIDERKADDDTWLAGGQLGVKVEPRADMHAMVGGGYYDYEEVKDHHVIFNHDDPFGNSSISHQVVVDGDTTIYEDYIWDYNLFEIFGEIGYTLETMSVTVYGNYVYNTGADSLNAGWLVGVTFKYGKGRGAVKVYANYRELEADAVIGAFTSSDFIGGGTDGKGLRAGASVGLAENVDLALTYFLNKIDLDEEIDYRRLQADIKMKF